MELHHTKLTDAILSEDGDNEELVFDERQLSHDEKCNLFYSLSHTVNHTALEDEPSDNIETFYSVSRSAPAPVRNLGTEIPIKTKAQQSQYLDEQENTTASGSSKRRTLRRKRQSIEQSA